MDTKREKECLHVALSITKLVLKTAALVAAFLTVKEIHKVHKSLERRK